MTTNKDLGDTVVTLFLEKCGRTVHILFGNAPGPDDGHSAFNITEFEDILKRDPSPKEMTVIIDEYQDLEGLDFS